MSMMRQASLDKPRAVRRGYEDEVEIRGVKMLGSEFKKSDQRRIKELRRPASADPGDHLRKHNRDEEKRMSAHANMPDYTAMNSSSRSINKSSGQSKSRSSSHHRQSSKETSRFSGTSCSAHDTSSSSRVLNISTDSFGDEYKQQSSRHSLHNSSKELRDKTKVDVYSQDPQAYHRLSRPEFNDSLSKQSVSRPGSKSSYYFGEAPNLEEILANLNGHENNVQEEEDAKTPMNEPIPLDIHHEGNSYHYSQNTPTTVCKNDATIATENEVVRIKVPFSEPYESSEPLLTTKHNMDRLAAHFGPQYNGHKVTIQVNRGDEGEGRFIHANSTLSPTERSSFHYNIKKVGSHQVTKRHITTTEKKVLLTETFVQMNNIFFR